MKKKIFAIVLCLIMAVALAIPAFATQSNVAPEHLLSEFPIFLLAGTDNVTQVAI